MVRHCRARHPRADRLAWRLGYESSRPDLELYSMRDVVSAPEEDGPVLVRSCCIALHRALAKQTTDLGHERLRCGALQSCAKRMPSADACDERGILYSQRNEARIGRRAHQADTTDRPSTGRAQSCATNGSDKQDQLGDRDVSHRGSSLKWVR